MTPIPSSGPSSDLSLPALYWQVHFKSITGRWPIEPAEIGLGRKRSIYGTLRLLQIQAIVEWIAGRIQ